MYNITTPYILPYPNFTAFSAILHLFCFIQPYDLTKRDRRYCNGLYGINSPTYKLQLTAVLEHIYCNSGLNVRPENIVITACTNVYTNEEQQSPCTRHSKSAHFDKTQSETNTFSCSK